MVRLELLLYVVLAVIIANCAKDSNLWKTRSVKEMSCAGMEKFFDQKVHKEATTLSYNRKMYRVMSNMLSLQGLSKRYTGKSVASKKDLQTACPYSEYKWTTGVFSAFGRKTKCKEDSSAPTHVKCTGDWNMTETKKYKNNGKVTYIWTDGEKYTLHLHCLGRQLHWILASTGTSVDKVAQKLVFKKIKDIGFNPKNAVLIPHHACKP